MTLNGLSCETCLQRDTITIWVNLMTEKHDLRRVASSHIDFSVLQSQERQSQSRTKAKICLGLQKTLKSYL